MSCACDSYKAPPKTFYQRHVFAVWYLIVTFFGYLTSLGIYRIFKSPVEAQLAVKQLEDSAVTYGLVHKMMYGSGIEMTMTIAYLLLSAIVAVPLIIKLFKEEGGQCSC